MKNNFTQKPQKLNAEAGAGTRSLDDFPPTPNEIDTESKNYGINKWVKR